MMERFAYAVGSTVEEALSVLGDDCRPLAGGTDLIGLMKRRLAAPARLVDLRSIPALHGVAEDGDGWSIGPLTTLSELGGRLGGWMPRELKILARAASASASPQLRHVATIGGNLVQRPRCWYFRNPRTRCWLKGGAHCFAAVGENAYHAILGAGTCHMVHPSDPAVALVALDGEVEIAGRQRHRRLPVSDFLVEPQQGRRSETVLGADELVTGLFLPRAPEGATGAYVKIAERATWDLALVSVAVHMSWSGGVVETVRVVLGGVAAKPWRARETEQVLRGEPLTAETIDAAAAASRSGAAPLSQNGYKVRLVEGAVREALRRVKETTNA